MSWETVIGLEIHAQLSTKSKIFSGSATAYGASPNSQASLVDLAYPGVLPVLNQEVVRMAVKFGLAIGAEIAPRSVFARKNYFYPDLPKGYQISQYELPIVAKGHMDIVLDDGTKKRIGITRAHLRLGYGHPTGTPSKPMLFSSACAASRMRASLNAGPAIWKPTGRPSERPHGIEMAGMPASGIGTV